MPMTIDRAMADEFLTTTRSVRKRLDFSRSVPRELVIEAIRISQQAPTAGNGQGWRWVVVDDAEKRKGLAEIYRAAAGSLLQDQRDGAAARGDQQTARVYDSAVYLRDHFHEAPVIVIPCLEGKPYPGHELSYFASIFPAVWSFQLALRARGLGTVLTTLHTSFKPKEAAALLGIPDTVTQCGLMPVAFTKGTDFKVAARPAVETIIHWNGW